MASHSHDKYYCSAHTKQFVSKSSHIDRFTSADDSELNVELLIENLKNVIMKKLFISCVTDRLAAGTMNFTFGLIWSGLIHFLA
ncbi:hypothetical protein BDBG_16125 [Blastomyces gilchristii SLH14081]|uniref:Uncharacterized protein n=1 Tax=Blastomyces gilchristii (strain SLH14081) TaxID=559298 RepID=A0A179U779_BLAGS|nr:uncharacterized protein BDBG_16125 [Blastomyces gilchristii SLH14081]OAT03856.1 hypothetical protein BDBG_16125 [Blastomyces gilchristii SLH14081]